ncbi:amino acid adenylation domain-containing protein [Pseudoalteromonas sp. A22]|uniref:non-ribosomal peptide synthetase n=2 Tax=unclassified Pseudoalteromonas TaxID=194690 RepID=UPI001BA7A4EB|nr:non-ribosomal peptide synthetase [Pseudoalteromonas sp. A22]QUI62930.1 amino acid adenylation domain-containing protein [Pseudoalteromonas sp. A22]
MLSLLAELKDHNLSIWLQDGGLELSFGAQAPDAALVAKLKSNKTQLMDYLEAKAIFSKDAFNTLPELNRHPLSFAQERLLFIERLENGTNAYHIPFLVKLSEHTELARLTQALNIVLDRHEVLRSVYRQDEQGHDYQEVLSACIEITPSPVADLAALNTAVKQAISTPFDLANEPMFKVCCWTVGAERYVLFMWHHIAFDGWSTEIFMRELHQAYFMLASGKTPELPALELQYQDYAKWQREYLSGDTLTKLLDHWTDALAGAEQLELHSPLPRPNEYQYHGADHRIRLGQERSEALKAIAKTQQTSLYVVLLSSWALTLQATSGQSDLIIGTPSDNRHLSQTQNLIGFLVNSLALPVHIDNALDFNALIQQVHQTLKAAKAHQDLPFDKLVDALKLQRDPSRHPLFQMMFSLEQFKNNSDDSSQQLFTPVDESQVKALHKVAKFDISLLLQNGDEEVFGDINYATALFPSDWIATLAERFINIIDQVIARTAQPLAKVALQNRTETDTIRAWHDNAASFAIDKDLASLVEQHAANTPELTAMLTSSGEALSYAEVNGKANALAKQIIAQHPKAQAGLLPADTPIALYFSRSSEMLIAILAVLKAGGAYVPVSPDYPEARVEFILTDTNTDLVLTQESHLPSLEPVLGKMAALGVKVLGVNTHALAVEHENLVRPTALANLAYIIYTSGTTGQPKGVMLTQHNVLYYLHALTSQLGDKYRNIDFSSNYCFDLSVTTTLCPLLAGQTVCVYEGDILDAAAFRAHLNAANVGFVKTTPSLAMALLPGSDAQVDALMLGGEALTEQAIAALSDHVNAIFDEYGPTEATVGAMLAQAYPRLHQGIGKAYPNVNLHVLSESLQPMPIGAPGELYISGLGVARGYLNRPELNAERFIDNPFSHDPAHSKLYKTGDLARFLDNGDLVYLGRNDEQVKIRGYRVELGEIAAAIVDQQGVQNAVVIDVPAPQGKALAAYLVAEPDLEITELKLALSAALPEYMVPSHLTLIEHIPLTGNGKLDRKALPAPELQADNLYVAPRNALETQLCEIWQQVLGLEQVGIEDNFFQIGGDSIVSIQLVSRLREAGLTVQVKEIFAAPTPARLAKLISANGDKKVTIKTEQGQLEGEFDLLPIQQWFFANQFANPAHFAQTFATVMPSAISDERLVELLSELAEQHDVLRLVFNQKTAHITQQYQQNNTMAPLVKLDADTLSDDELAKQLTRLQSQFELNSGPLWQPIRVKRQSQDVLVLAFHHLIIDFVSWRILIEDLNSLYQGKKLAQKTSSYRQWVETLAQYAHVQAEQIDYWQEVLDTCQTHLTAKNTPTNQVIKLDSAFTQTLLFDANQGYHTEPRDLVVAALSLTLAHITGSNDQVIALEGHGREHISEDIDHSRTVGWFTSLYPLALHAGSSLESAIVNAKEQLRKLPDNGVGFGQFYFSKQVTGTLPTVAFNYLGQIGGTKTQQPSGDFYLTEAITGQPVASENNGHYVLDINAAIIHGQLVLNCTTALSETEFALFQSQFTASLQAVLDTALHTKALGAKQTPSDYNLTGVSFAHLDALRTRYDLAAVYPATNLQQGFIFHQLNSPEDTAYRVQSQMQYFDKVDTALYCRAWQLTSLQYPALRCAFDVEETMLQLIVDHTCVDEDNFSVIDISHYSKAEQQAHIEKLANQVLNQPFNFARPGLFTLHLVKRGEAHYHLIKTEHHSICDGWSGPLVMQTVHQNYTQLLQGREPVLPVDNAYLDAHAYLRDNQAATKAFWQYHVADLSQANDLNTLFSHSTDLETLRHNHEPQTLHFALPNEALSKLQQACQQHSVTLNAAVQFAWHKLIQIYTRDEFTLVGTTIAGRDLPIDGIEQSVGAYINTLPLYLDWPTDATIAQQLEKIQTAILDLNSHANVSLASLQQGGNRLFQSLVVFENYPSLENEQAEAQQARWQFDAAPEQVEYPLALIAKEQGELQFELMYDASLLSPARAAQLQSQLLLILKQVADNTHLPHQHIEIANTVEKARILNEWNKTERKSCGFENFNDLFSERVAVFPDATAVVWQDEALSYQALNRQARQLAQQLLVIKAEVYGNEYQGDFPVLLLHEKQLDSIVAILAILKAGGGYVPVSPEFPDSRIEYIAKDCGAKIVVTQSGLMDRVASTTLASLTHVLSDAPMEETSLDQAVSVSTSDLAYIIYTSGTTGNPKGVEINHAALLNYATDDHFIDPTQLSKVLSLSSISFDAFIFDCFVTLSNGAALHLIDKQTQLDPERLIEYCQAQQIDTCFVTTALFNRLASEDFFLHAGLKQINFGGEAVDLAMVERVKHQAPELMLYHAYGPTETTVYATCCLLNSVNHGAPIGRAIANKSAYVLSPAGKILPPGVAGELYIGGAGMARRYLHRSDLTEQAFLVNPFASDRYLASGWNKMYKTGDLVKWREDGLLEYVGRNDFQVKIRGYRIELGEIETAIKQQPQIHTAFVNVSEQDGVKRIVAYLVMANTESLDEAKLKQTLSHMLPSYMLPSAYVTLDALPVTVNGKIDARALPQPDFSQTETHHAPNTEQQKHIAKIWCAVLGIKQIGLEDNFFHIGGDSIMSIQLMSALKRAGYSLSTKDIFTYPTLETLCAFLANNEQVEIEAEQGELSGEIKLLPIQQWFLNSHYRHKAHFNQSVMLALPHNTALDTLERALAQLHQQHDMLRAQFSKTETWQSQYQSVAACPTPKLIHLDTSGLDEQQTALALTKIHARFELGSGALWQPVLLSDDTPLTRLVLIVHHLVIDGVSWRILVEDLSRLLQGDTLSDKTSSYRQWSDVVALHPFEQQIPYWQNVLSTQQNVPYGKSQQRLTHQFDTQLTEQLLRLAPAGFNTEINDLLMSAFTRAWCNTFATNYCHLTLEGHGREHLSDHIDTSRTLGWFTSMFPVALKNDTDLSTLIIQSKETLRAIPDKGLGFSELVRRGEFSFNQLPKVSFNYLGQLDSNNDAQDQGIRMLNAHSGDASSKDNQDEMALIVNAEVRQMKLQVSIASQLDETQTTAFIEQFDAALRAVVSHSITAASPQGIKTLSDIEIGVLVNEADAPIEWFFFPPGGGGAESYLQSIAPKISAPCYCFNNIYAAQEKPKGSLAYDYYQFQTLALQYAIHLKKLKPSGPYRIFGWSFGATLALEVAKLLQNEGDTVEHLVFVDPCFDYAAMHDEVFALHPEFSHLEPDRINYHYQNDPAFSSTAKVTLFSAGCAVEVAQSDSLELQLSSHIINRYLDKNQNLIEEAMQPSQVQVFTMKGSHNSWVKTPEDLIKMSEIMNTL